MMPSWMDGRMQVLVRVIVQVTGMVLLLAVGAHLGLAAEKGKKAQQGKDAAFKHEEKGRIYYAFVPPEWSKEGAQPPGEPDLSRWMLVWLHPGSGVAQPEFAWWRHDKKTFGKQPQTLLLAPQAKQRLWDARKDAAFVTKLVEEQAKTYGIATNRIIIGGHSNGGMFAYYLALKDSKAYAGLLAAATDHRGRVPRAPKTNPLPIHIYHSTNDNVFAYAKAEKLLAALQKAGYPAVMTTDKQQHSIGSKLWQSHQELRDLILKAEQAAPAK